MNLGDQGVQYVPTDTVMVGDEANYAALMRLIGKIDAYNGVHSVAINTAPPIDDNDE